MNLMLLLTPLTLMVSNVIPLPYVNRSDFSIVSSTTYHSSDEEDYYETIYEITLTNSNQTSDFANKVVDKQTVLLFDFGFDLYDDAVFPDATISYGVKLKNDFVYLGDFQDNFAYGVYGLEPNTFVRNEWDVPNNGLFSNFKIFFTLTTYEPPVNTLDNMFICNFQYFIANNDNVNNGYLYDLIYDNAYNDGFNDGFNDGYNERGAANNVLGTTIASIWGSIISFIIVIGSIEIYGISLLMIIGLMALIGVAVLIFKVLF